MFVDDRHHTHNLYWSEKNFGNFSSVRWNLNSYLVSGNCVFCFVLIIKLIQKKRWLVFVLFWKNHDDLMFFFLIVIRSFVYEEFWLSLKTKQKFLCHPWIHHHHHQFSIKISWPLSCSSHRWSNHDESKKKNDNFFPLKSDSIIIEWSKFTLGTIVYQRKNRTRTRIRMLYINPRKPHNHTKTNP
mgnify:CR=1 FL=1